MDLGKTTFFNLKALCVTILMVLSVTPECFAREGKKQVLILNSYSWGMVWADSEVEGIRSVFNEHGVEADLLIEQMDVIGHTQPFDADFYADYLRWRFRERKFDLIIANDDAALRFVANKYHELFSGTPVVFNDVNGFGSIPIPPDMPVTGVAEHKDFLPTIEIALELRPNARMIAVFGNTVDNGAGPRRALQYLMDLNSDLPFEFHLDKTVEEIKSISSKLAVEDIVFGLAYARDKNGILLDYNEVRGVISENSPAASFVFWKTESDDKFAVGGKVSSANEQGRAAALIAARVLSGEDIRSIPIIAAPTNYVFNYPIMTRMGISEDALPEGSEILQKPFSVYDAFKAEVWSIISLILGLCVVIFILIKTVTNQKRAETALKISEDRFREFANIGADWFWETDINLRITFLSEKYILVFGNPRNVYIGKSYQEVHIPADIQDVPELLGHQKQLDLRQAFTNFEIDRRNTDGSGHYISVSGKPIFDNGGTFLGYRGVGQDITMRKETGEALEAALVAAERANNAKSEFLATMSHEFRTPLNAILGFSEMLRTQYFGPLGSNNYKIYAEDIHNSGQHMLSLVNDVLDIAELEAGKRSFSKEDIDVSEMIKECIKKIRLAINDHGHTLSVSVPDSLPYLYSNKRSILQILLNLISNSIKYTEDNGNIIVSVKISNQYMQFVVQDSGVGISPDRIHKITEPFSQSKTDPYMAEEGAGLGLSIVNSLVKSLDGYMKIESTVNIGTTVSVSFPCQATNS